MFKCSVLLFCVLVTIVAGVYPTTDGTCFGLDISREPRLEARMVRVEMNGALRRIGNISAIRDEIKIDGWWFQHRISKEALSFVPANSIFLWQFQGKTSWALDWDPKTQKCTYRKFKESQKQSVTVGPFLPCWNSTQILPTEDQTFQLLYWVPTRNLFVYYTCVGELRGRKCVSQPLVGVITRTRDISRRELNMVRRKLRSLGISMDILAVANPRENRCPLPMTTFKKANREQSRRKVYGLVEG